MQYVGDELKLFAQAHNWKQRIKDEIDPFLGKKVLEVGSGIGSNTKIILTSEKVQNIVCLEPDKELVETAKSDVNLFTKTQGLNTRIDFVHGTIQCLDRNISEGGFDSIVYLDVLEHIEDDKTELERSLSLLTPNGYLIVVSPAWNFLYSEFDKAIGHFRRYNKRSIGKILPDGSAIVVHRYLDSVGLIASSANRLFLKQSYPTVKQIRVWDKFMVPLSYWLDPIFGYQFGKSIILVLRRNNND